MFIVPDTSTRQPANSKRKTIYLHLGSGALAGAVHAFDKRSQFLRILLAWTRFDSRGNVDAEGLEGADCRLHIGWIQAPRHDHRKLEADHLYHGASPLPIERAASPAEAFIGLRVEEKRENSLASILRDQNSTLFQRISRYRGNYLGNSQTLVGAPLILQNVLECLPAVQLYHSQAAHGNELTNAIRIGVHEHPDFLDFSGQGSNDFLSGFVVDVSRTLVVEHEAQCVGSSFNGRAGVFEIRDSANLDPSHRSNRQPLILSEA